MRKSLAQMTLCICSEAGEQINVFKNETDRFRKSIYNKQLIGEKVKQTATSRLTEIMSAGENRMARSSNTHRDLCFMLSNGQYPSKDHSDISVSKHCLLR